MLICPGRHSKPSLNILNNLPLERLLALGLLLSRLAARHARVPVVARAAPPGSAPRRPRKAGAHCRLRPVRDRLLLLGVRDRRRVVEVARPTAACARVPARWRCWAGGRRGDGVRCLLGLDVLRVVAM